LEYFANILNRGKIVFLSPEGELSPDGKPCPIRGGLHRLVKMSQQAVKILPMNISYDFMTTGRLKIFLNIGREITDTKGLPKAELERQVKDCLLKLTVVTISQIGSYSLYREATNGNDVFLEEGWQDRLSVLVQKVQRAGFIVNKALLEERTFYRNFRDFLGYCLRNGQLASTSPGKLQINRERILDTTSTGYLSNPVYYCYNEFKTLLGSDLVS
jgi:hypothetical protein